MLNYNAPLVSMYNHSAAYPSLKINCPGSASSILASITAPETLGGSWEICVRKRSIFFVGWDLPRRIGTTKLSRRAVVPTEAWRESSWSQGSWRSPLTRLPLPFWKVLSFYWQNYYSLTKGIYVFGPLLIPYYMIKVINLSLKLNRLWQNGTRNIVELPQYKELLKELPLPF